MKSMKLNHEKATKEDAMCANLYGSGRPDYPHGLSIHLEEEQLKILGITELPEIGTEMTVTAKVKVKNSNSSKSETGTYRSLALQITDMDLKK